MHRRDICHLFTETEALVCFVDPRPSMFPEASRCFPIFIDWIQIFADAWDVLYLFVEWSPFFFSF